MTKNAFNQFLLRIILFVFVLLALVLVIKEWRKEHQNLKLKQANLVVEQVLTTGNPQPALQYTSQLQSNVLYPYVVYTNLSGRLKSLPTAEVSHFLTQYADTPLADKLRKQWLRVLAGQQQWTTFLQFYQTDPAPESQCLYATALLNSGQISQAYSLAEGLWLVSYSQSPSCNNLFASWINAAQLTPDMVWQRFQMAIAADQINLATYLVNLLPLEQQAYAKAWLEVRAKPQLILNPSIFFPDDDKPNDLIIYGIQGLAHIDADQAAEAWQSLRMNHHFSAAQAQLAIQAIAIAFIKGDHERAMTWLQQVDPAYLTDTAKNWRLLFALREENWSLLLEWINQLSPVDKNDPQWQYWYARALEQTGQEARAIPIYQSLITQRGYYSFLSANRLGLPINISNQPLALTQSEIDQFLANPGIQRMQALYAINQIDLGKAEWWFAVLNMTSKQRYVAAKMAAKWQLYPLSLATTAYLSEQNDLDLRYPQPYLAQVKKAATAMKMDPAFIYAIIRQESLFNPVAASQVGAQGLMQLMPATATMLVRQDKLPAANAEQLSNPYINIQLGSIYLSRLLNSNSLSPALAAAAYNAGPNRIKQWLPSTGRVDLDVWVDSIPYPETRTYVKHVLTYMLIYQYLLGQQPSTQLALEPISA